MNIEKEDIKQELSGKNEEHKNEKKDKQRFMPLIMALCVVLGIVVGNFYAKHASGNRLNIIGSGSNRLQNLIQIIDDQYVDTVNVNDLVERAIPGILRELDPHSSYISAADVATANDDLKGSFSGVGIEFTVRKDTIHVQNVVKNGPAERVGIIAGDKIISIDGQPFVGKKVTNEEAIRRLKGPKDTKVKVGVIRYGQAKPLHFTITRADIQTKSITATYMLDESTGYIRIKNFSETTYQEMLVALAQLSQEGFSNLVIDLRDNMGGLLDAAVSTVNEFLPANKMIVYTEGKKYPRENYMSDGRGVYQHIPLVLLINETSASAAEIFAGAIQDNDRGTVVGRRSFGKGLVQRQILFSDGSMVRLTIARYYTPSGRCIQKPYSADNTETYDNDLITRYQHGEFFSKDSIHHKGQKYHTSIGRIVYGGGGITPDVFVAEDTTFMTSYFKRAAMSGLLLQYAYQYTDEHRQELKKYSKMEQIVDAMKKVNIVEQFATYAEKQGLQRRNLLIKKSHRLIEQAIVGRIIYNMLNEEEWVRYLNQDDQVIKTTLGIFQNKAAFPRL